MSNYDEESDEFAKNIIRKLSVYERIGQQVILGKESLIDYDRRRQKCREAVTALKKQRGNQNGKTFLCLGTTAFLQLPTKQAIELVTDDIKLINEELEKARVQLHNDVNELKKMEGEKDLTELGFTLRPIY
ncbi:hypothetical protein AB6A40_007539 [Gnathostoma spinigerum]|uniref:P53 and DNA damage-regulated protein 1 n=1 Tax=Gnathostoma spinigerum TaxID=75299 RepID=A0ABD6EMR1_9BILA